jgi:hypothetical protein
MLGKLSGLGVEFVVVQDLLSKVSTLWTFFILAVVLYDVTKSTMAIVAIDAWFNESVPACMGVFQRLTQA